MRRDGFHNNYSDKGSVIYLFGRIPLSFAALQGTIDGFVRLF
jgi:hypothetical protein